MWVVARRAVECVVAFGEAAAPGERGRLKADGSWDRRVRPSVPRGLWHWAHRFTIGAPEASEGPGDCQVGKLGGDRQQVVPARTVTFLAADPMVVRSRSVSFEHCPRVGDVTEKAAADRIGRQWLAQVFREIRRVDRMTGGHVPERMGAAAIMRQPQLSVLAVIVSNT